MSESSGSLRELLATFIFGVETKELEKGKTALSEFYEKTKKIAEGLAAVFAVDQLFEYAEAQVHAVTAVEHMAAQVGISTEAIQAWQYAAQASGYEADKFTNAMSRLQVAAGSEHGAKAFTALGISVKDAAGHTKQADELFGDVADAIKKTADPTKRAVIATQLFGRSGRELLPILSEGREGLEELTGGFKQYGMAYTDEDIEKTKRFEGAHTSLGAAFAALRTVIGRVLLPAFTALMDFGARLGKGFAELAKNSEIVKAALVVFGGVAAFFGAQLLIAAAPILAIGAAMGALVLIVDDLINLFEGNDSLIGRWIDDAFGKGQSTAVVKELKDDWYAVVKAVKEAWQWVDKYTGELKESAKILSWTLGLPFHIAAALGEEIGRENANLDEHAAGGYAQATAKAQRARAWQAPNASYPPPPSDYMSLPQSPAAYFTPYAPTPTSSSAVSTHSESSATSSVNAPITVNVTAPAGANAQEIGDHAAYAVEKIVHKAIAAKNRATMDMLPRSGGR